MYFASNFKTFSKCDILHSKYLLSDNYWQIIYNLAQLSNCLWPNVIWMIEYIAFVQYHQSSIDPFALNTVRDVRLPTKETSILKIIYNTFSSKCICTSCILNGNGYCIDMLVLCMCAGVMVNINSIQLFAIHFASTIVELQMI